MKTPYDSAVRVQQRALDELRTSISEKLAELANLERLYTTVDDAIARETALAAREPLLRAHGYLARMRAERAWLIRDRTHAEERLAELRIDALGTAAALKALESAAETYRRDAERAAAAAEQAMVDDLSATMQARNRTLALPMPSP